MTLDPQIEWVLGLVEKAAYPLLETLSPAEARAQYEATATKLDCEPTPMTFVDDRTIAGPGGPLPLRLYTPGDAPPDGSPALVFFHGGGWVIGSIETHDRVCRALAAEAACKVVSVGYRLAPEHKFPAAVEDAVAAYRWVHGATELGVDRARIAVGGDSAGGNLAAVVAQAARDAPPCFQLLVYPATDLAGDYPSLEANADGYLLTRPFMDWCMGHYLDGAGSPEDPRASPLRAGDLSGLPPALVITAGYDPLRDEGAAYAEALRAAGADARHSDYPGMIHGFFNMSGAVDGARRAVDEAAAALRAAFA